MTQTFKTPLSLIVLISFLGSLLGVPSPPEPLTIRTLLWGTSCLSTALPRRGAQSLFGLAHCLRVWLAERPRVSAWKGLEGLLVSSPAHSLSRRRNESNQCCESFNTPSFKIGCWHLHTTENLLNIPTSARIRATREDRNQSFKGVTRPHARRSARAQPAANTPRTRCQASPDLELWNVTALTDCARISRFPGLWVFFFA